MIGHRSPRYARFGWAAARLDDVANYVGARVTGALVVVCAPLVGGSASGARRAWRRDAARASQPQRRRRRGGLRRSAGRAAGRPDAVPPRTADPARRSGDGRPPEVADLRRAAVRLSRVVQAAAAVLAVARGARFSGAGRSGRRVSASTVTGCVHVRGAAARLLLLALPAAHLDLGVDEIARDRSARRCRTRSTGCRRTGTDRHPGAAAGSRRGRRAGSRPAADRTRPAARRSAADTWSVSMAYTCRKPCSVKGSLSGGTVSESRSRAGDGHRAGRRRRDTGNP